MLLKRFDYEKCKLLIKNGPDDAIFEEISATCCVLSSEMLHMRSGFDSWLDILPIVDCASCFLDMELLQELSSLTLVGNGELQLVSEQQFASCYFCKSIKQRTQLSALPS